MYIVVIWATKFFQTKMADYIKDALGYLETSVTDYMHQKGHFDTS